MNILFVHQNFPGQFKHLVPALAAKGHGVWAMPLKNLPSTWQHGVHVRPYGTSRGSSKQIHPWVVDFETKVIRAEAAFQHAMQLRKEGLLPDAIMAPSGQQLARGDEVVTFVNRNLEPYRGYHVFMRALPELLRLRPRAQVLLVGGDEVSYGAPPDPALHGGRSWAQVFADEVRPKVPAADWQRVHMLGKLPYAAFLRLLQVSSAHVYLTYPFVLSWSLLEAMSTGCAIVASNTAPVLEVLEHERTALLVDFFDQTALVEQVCRALQDPGLRSRLGAAARQKAVAEYDLNRVCLPGQMAWVEGLVT